MKNFRRLGTAPMLIVEDEVQVLLLAESILQGAGYDTLTASTLAEAQAVLHSEHKVDLIFTDITLGDADEAGLQVGQFANQLKELPVIYTTGRGVTDGMIALFVERHAFLPKPWKPEDLIAKVAEMLREP
jgi:DNA-binding NtrC family response regulator